MTALLTGPRRIHRKRAKGWRMPEGAVAVDRTTGFGNPFPVGKASPDRWSVGTWTGPAMWIVDSREEAVRHSVTAYRHWILSDQGRKVLERAKRELRGKDLACWCPLDKQCHADVLLELANE